MRGVALLAISEAGLEFGEYSPLEIKTSVVGYGRAEKHQVQVMVTSLLRLDRAHCIGRRLRRAGGGHVPRHAPRACAASWKVRAHEDGHWRLPFCPLLAARCAAAVLFQVIPGQRAGLRRDRDRSHRRTRTTKKRADDDQPLKFQLAESDANEIFGLADKLGRFNHPLEAPVKVAFMGMKTFRFENGAEKNEVKFNFSEDPDAQAAAGLVRAYLRNRTASD